MATSSTFSTSNQYIKYRIVVTENSTSIPNNTSNITVKVQVWRTNSGYTTYGTGTCYCTINGTQYTASITRDQKFTYNSYTQVFSKTLNITHNADGSKTIYVSSRIDHTQFDSSTQGFNVTLTKIPRYATSTQTLNNKTETTITMNWKSDSTVDYIWYSTNNGSSWTGINVTDGTGGSYTISNLSANTTYNIKTRVRRKDSQLTTDSSALAVTTYAYPYANSMPNFTIGNQLTLGIYNPLKRSVTVNILGADNSQISNDTTTGTSITGYNNATIQSRLYQSIPNSKTGTYKVKVTYGSQITTKTGGTYSVNENVCKPTIGSVSYEDTNSAVTSITDDNQLIVRNQSKVQFNASNLTGYDGATISSGSVSVNSNSYSMSVSGSSASINNINIDSAMDVEATITITDSRGVQATSTLEVSMLDWVLPTAIIVLQRQNNFYSETDINVDPDYSSIDGKNEITLKARYKKTTDANYGSYVTLQENVTSVLNLDNLYEWDVQVLVQDLFGSTTYNAVVQEGMPIIYFDRIKSSTGFNCFPQDAKSVEVSGTNITSVINEQNNKIGDLTLLRTANKTDLVSAANELTPYILFDGTTKSAITLSDDASNYTYLEFFYAWDGGGLGFSSTKVFSPNGKDADLTTVVLNNNAVYIGNARWHINGTSVTPVIGEYWRWNAGGTATRTQTAVVNIWRIVGYK